VEELSQPGRSATGRRQWSPPGGVPGASARFRERHASRVDEPEMLERDSETRLREPSDRGWDRCSRRPSPGVPPQTAEARGHAACTASGHPPRDPVGMRGVRLRRASGGSGTGRRPGATGGLPAATLGGQATTRRRRWPPWHVPIAGVYEVEESAFERRAVGPRRARGRDAFPPDGIAPPGGIELRIPPLDRNGPASRGKHRAHQEAARWHRRRVFYAYAGAEISTKTARALAAELKQGARTRMTNAVELAAAEPCSRAGERFGRGRRSRSKYAGARPAARDRSYRALSNSLPAPRRRSLRCRSPATTTLESPGAPGRDPLQIQAAREFSAGRILEAPQPRSGSGGRAAHSRAWGLKAASTSAKSHEPAEVARSTSAAQVEGRPGRSARASRRNL